MNNQNKYKAYAVLFLLFYIMIIMNGCKKEDKKETQSDSIKSNNVQTQIEPNDSSEYYIDIFDKSFNLWESLASEDPENIILTIYYVDDFILTRAPWDVQMLIDSSITDKIVVDGGELSKYSDLLSMVDYSIINPVNNNSSQLNARIYYVFESNENGKLFDVAMWSTNGVIVNNQEVEYSDIFEDVIEPFFDDETWENIWDVE